MDWMWLVCEICTGSRMCRWRWYPVTGPWLFFQWSLLLPSEFAATPSCNWWTIYTHIICQHTHTEVEIHRKPLKFVCFLQFPQVKKMPGLPVTKMLLVLQVSSTVTLRKIESLQPFSLLHHLCGVGLGCFVQPYKNPKSLPWSFWCFRHSLWLQYVKVLCRQQNYSVGFKKNPNYLVK